MPVDVRIPSLGESVTEGIIVRWLKASGDTVKTDELLLELETDKASVEIPAETGGVLEVLKPEGEKVQVGDIVARIDAAGVAKPPPAAPAPAASPSPAASTPSPSPAATQASVPAPTPAAAAAAKVEGLSPAVRRLVEEHGLQPDAITGSGRAGRLTKADVLAHIERSAEGSAATPATPVVETAAPEPAQPTAAVVPATKAQAPAVVTGGDDRRVPMTYLRQRIAERLVQAQHTAAILTTFNEVDMSAVMELRSRHKEAFAKKHGVGLGFMSFFARACLMALRDVPVANAQIDGTDIVYKSHVNLGVAVGTERGLVVPVVHHADQMSFAEIEKEIGRLAELARLGKLGIQDLSGGTFTISNGGVYGSLMSTPILNPPQSAILGMHKIEKRPVVIGDQIVVRPMMYLAVSYDHRLIDGEHAVTFLVRIKERIEDPTRLLFDI